ncbi:ciliary-associated calcium-binding coiled-coil protein 1-like [Halichondria panicea]|uniref:ciliary-associated calcium-binding coiled-coil protein 1-like n=1 Tax=Halichondria panicea TaxID=6063 RepID=UPI00312B368F
MSRSGSRTKLGSSKKKGKGSKNNEPEEDEGPAEITVPQLEWMILSEEATKELAELEVEEVSNKLARVLSMSRPEEDLREAALLDYFVSGYWFAAREEGLSDVQVSAFITILHTLLDNLKSKQLSLEENILAFKEMVAAVGNPPSPVVPNPLKCFTMETGLFTLRYLKSSLFQHYSLFHYLLSEEQEEEIIIQNLIVNVPPDPTTLCPPPLEEAVTLDLYQRCISPPPPPPPEEQADEEDVTDNSEVPEVSEGVRQMKVSAEELKLVMEDIAKMKLTSYKEEMSQKLKRKEEVMLTRLSKLENKLT